MSEQDSCPNGRSDCDYAEKHELALAGGILRMIESYTKHNETYPCPKCLRNSMMAIAALLHLEAEKMDENGSGQSSPDSNFVETFAEAARERILSVMDAVVDVDDLLGKRKLM
jgi:hypothetical protein